MALGALSAAWGELEYSLVVALQFAARIEFYKAEIILFSLSNHRARRDILAGLASTIKLSDVKSEYEALIASIGPLATQRNVFTHASWLRDRDSGEIFILNHKRPGDHQDRTRHVHAKEILDLAVKIDTKAKEIVEFFVGVHASGRSQEAFS
jgi:hypothetical protein